MNAMKSKLGYVVAGLFALMAMAAGGASAQSTTYDPTNLVPTAWTPTAVFGGVAGILANPLFLSAIVIAVAIGLGPRLFRMVKKLVGRA